MSDGRGRRASHRLRRVCRPKAESHRHSPGGGTRPATVSRKRLRPHPAAARCPPQDEFSRICRDNGFPASCDRSLTTSRRTRQSITPMTAGRAIPTGLEPTGRATSPSSRSRKPASSRAALVSRTRGNGLTTADRERSLTTSRRTRAVFTPMTAGSVGLIGLEPMGASATSFGARSLKRVIMPAALVLSLSRNGWRTPRSRTTSQRPRI